MPESVPITSPETYYSDSKSQLLLTGSFEHSQGIQAVQELLGIGLRLLHPESKIDPQVLEVIPAKTAYSATAMREAGAHGDFQGIDPDREPILRLRDMIGIVNDGKMPQYFYDAAYRFFPQMYAPQVPDKRVAIPEREHADWVWFGILSNMVERDNYYLTPDDDGRVLGRPGDPSKRDIYDSQFCRLILQQQPAYTEEYTEIMREVRKFLQRELPYIQEKLPDLYTNMTKVIERYNILPHSKPIKNASWKQLEELNKGEV